MGWYVHRFASFFYLAGELVAWHNARTGELDSSRASRCKNTSQTRAN